MQVRKYYLLIWIRKVMRSSGLGIEKDDLELCVHDVLIDGEPIADIIHPTMLKKLFVAPATIQLAGAEVELVSLFHVKQC